MSDVQFEEGDCYSRPTSFTCQSESSPIIRFVLKKGLAKEVNSANKILIVFLILFIIVTTMVFYFYNNNSSKPTSYQLKIMKSHMPRILQNNSQ